MLQAWQQGWKLGSFIVKAVTVVIVTIFVAVTSLIGVIIYVACTTPTRTSAVSPPLTTPARSYQAQISAQPTPSPPPAVKNTSQGSSGPVHVDGYYRKDGTYVKGHTRAKPRK